MHAPPCLPSALPSAAATQACTCIPRCTRAQLAFTFLPAPLSPPSQIKCLTGVVEAKVANTVAQVRSRVQFIGALQAAVHWVRSRLQLIEQPQLKGARLAHDCRELPSLVSLPLAGLGNVPPILLCPPAGQAQEL